MTFGTLRVLGRGLESTVSRYNKEEEEKHMVKRMNALLLAVAGALTVHAAYAADTITIGMTVSQTGALNVDSVAS